MSTNYFPSQDEYEAMTPEWVKQSDQRIAESHRKREALKQEKTDLYMAYIKLSVPEAISLLEKETTQELFSSYAGDSLKLSNLIEPFGFKTVSREDVDIRFGKSCSRGYKDYLILPDRREIKMPNLVGNICQKAIQVLSIYGTN